MRRTRYIGAALAAITILFAASTASAFVFRLSGDLTITDAVNEYAPLNGKTGSFFFDLDTGVTDPNPNFFPGDIPGAVTGSGVSIDGEEFVDFSDRSLSLFSELPEGFNARIRSGPLSSANFSDLNLGLIIDYDFLGFFENPLVKARNAGGEFGLLFVLFGLPKDTPVTLVGSNGVDSFIFGNGSITGSENITGLNDPDPGFGQGPGQGQQPPSAVPVPAAFPLLMTAMAALFAVSRRRRAAA